MTSTDAAFAGSIPALYDRCLGPLLFQPYAEDMARRVTKLRPARILETAAGTGIVTEALARALPEAEIVATDLNQAMLDVAARRVRSPNVSFMAADAQSLPFADASFDAVVCQFGVMFFPDRIAAYREARRVLRPGGRFLFNCWDRLDRNPVSDIVASAVAALFQADPPSFLNRVPFGYHDKERVMADLRAAGFSDTAGETVVLESRLASARDAALGLCQGSPLRSEIEQRDPARIEEATSAVAEALSRQGYGDSAASPLSAHVFSAA
ncbi:MAG: Ubiquinone/menaquinone biosynthesis methyltransferase [uncultured Sphingosinicella sp.]|uniref:Ubiquinone/menaquinone biosynthesis methyltransferase n=1 Tax=uncultured Sphingosinicella sp. TaxID=478748 RepID=A0A6J4U329_9SPHN|nr:class I SAM-dependent methyltransferase [uncultured Sphingosinicella sp.]CAA9539141.1 MAG: Ubiquinone/menaquinone biosynthesis methyltransferase [uncultured Sphingosinicella sp.]